MGAKKIPLYYEKQYAGVKGYMVISVDSSVLSMLNFFFFFYYFSFSEQQETKQNCLEINVLLLKVQLFKTFAVFDYI